MTHTLHRLGRPDDLQDDYTIIFMSAGGYNNVGSQEKLRTFLRLAMKHHAVNFGNMEAGSALFKDPEEIIEAVKDGTTVQACFASETDYINIVKELKYTDLGMSVIIGGLADKVNKCCREAGVTPHTWNHSLGVWGKTELLPPRDVMELTTMCGHGMVAVSLVYDVMDKIKAGKMTYKEGAMRIAKPCICGLVNPVRAERILKRLCEDKL